VTGAASGIGAATTAALAKNGADVAIAYYAGDPYDPAPIARSVEAAGRRALVVECDVASRDAVDAAVATILGKLGRLDIVIANAGIVRLGDEPEDFLTLWKDIVDTNLTGVFHTVKASQQHIIDSGEGGSIVITSSSAGIKGTGSPKTGGAAYTAAKRGLVGYMQVLANDLAKYMIRVNTIHPTGVATGMTMNEAMMRMVGSGDPALASMQNALPIEILQPEDIANAVAWLVSDEAKFITGVALPLDAGFTVR
jgi:NAD(P)-dependent dehydrogenase (short-subunit alcohol dehydrogenase family)